MSPSERFNAVLDRIAVTPNVIRTRREDAARAERQVDDWDERRIRIADALEKFAAEIEKAIA